MKTGYGHSLHLKMDVCVCHFIGDTLETSEAWRYFGLQLFEGNPVACGRCIASHTTSSQARRTLQANVIAGKKYYLLLDNYTPPACGRFLEMQITFTTGGCASSLESLEGEAGLSWSLSPSPAYGFIRLSGYLTDSRDFHIQVLSASGKLIYEEWIGEVVGHFNYVINSGSWSGGLYLIRLSDGITTSSRSILILK
ncbi:MAG: hypothetical protein RMJ66_00210 [Bacteroidia bacterium]|nr:T9SS type A sorting domain-containing protein [Bacteroidia bacterium]MDW8133466.1 hypothetical protein [Bacteroidia bacterium]